MVTYPDHTIRNIPDLIKAAKDALRSRFFGGVPAPERRSI